MYRRILILLTALVMSACTLPRADCRENITDEYIFFEVASGLAKISDEYALSKNAATCTEGHCPVRVQGLPFDYWTGAVSIRNLSINGTDMYQEALHTRAKPSGTRGRSCTADMQLISVGGKMVPYRLKWDLYSGGAVPPEIEFTQTVDYRWEPRQLVNALTSAENDFRQVRQNLVDWLQRGKPAGGISGPESFKSILVPHQASTGVDFYAHLIAAYYTAVGEPPTKVRKTEP